MKASKELIEWLEALTRDQAGFPRENQEIIGIQVGTLRGLLAILHYEYKELNRGENTTP